MSRPTDSASTARRAAAYPGRARPPTTRRPGGRVASCAAAPPIGRSRSLPYRVGPGPLRATAPGPREERRTVTVLFVDMVGFTRVCGELDPEDVRALQSAYFRVVRRVIDRWRGVVEKYVGDAVLAVFGAPRSDEFDAYRAVRAGMDLSEAFAGVLLPDGSPIRVRVGVATGEAVVDLDAARNGGLAFVSGHVVNMASRVQVAAAADTVLVTAATMRATASLVRYEELPWITVAGRQAPLEVWRARVARSAVVPVPVHGVALVGRRRELSVLVDGVTAAVRDRVPRIMPVIGPAGIGKSRLVEELAARLGSVDGVPVRWWRGRRPPGAADWRPPFLELIHAPAPVGGDRAGILEVIVPDGAVPGAAVPDEDPAALGRLLLATAGHGPFVLVIEDLTPADRALARFLSGLVAAAAAAAQPPPFAVVVTGRGRLPGELADWHRTEPTVQVGPLAPVATARLLRRLLCRAGQPARLAERLRPFAGGNPGYAQEYVRMLAFPDADASTWARPGGRPVSATGVHGATDAGATDAGATGDLPVPDAVRRLVSAQLDRLAEADRIALQVASVLGDAVSAGALAALLGADPSDAAAALRRLETAGLVTRLRPARPARPAPPARPTAPAVAAPPSYAFRQPVVRRIAYERLPRRVRAAYRRRADERLRAAGPSGPTTAVGARRSVKERAYGGTASPARHPHRPGRRSPAERPRPRLVATGGTARRPGQSRSGYPP